MDERNQPAGVSGDATPDDEDRRQDTTVDCTGDGSLWRAATVADDDGPPGAVTDDLDPRALGDPELRYAVCEVLGVGGMGEVRRCLDAAIGREVAWKTLRGDVPPRARLRRRFLREARIQGQLEHPSIVPVYDLGAGPEGELFFTMRRLRGRTLADVVAALARDDPETRAAYTRRKLLAAFVRVCLAVDYAHARGVVHRDLKPANIMVGDFGEVYVLDWGVARVVDGGAAPLLLPDDDELAAGTAGTPGYMAPEQRDGRGDRQGPRTDVYALGAILYELLALRPLHRAATDHGELDARPGLVVPDVPPELDEACVRAVADDLADRFPSARALAEVVERYLDGDRDLARRRELAAAHVERAREAAARGRCLAAAEAEAAHTEALRSVMRALALDADHAEAHALFAGLVVEVPEQLPPSVEREAGDVAAGVRLQVARFLWYAMAAWSVTIPMAAYIGVRDLRPFALASLLCVSAGLYARWIWRRGAATMAATLVLAALIAATCAALACWLGPFVLVPTAGACAAVWFTTMVDRRLRIVVTAMFGLSVLVPLALELSGWLPPSFSFADDAMILHARALHLPPLATTLALVYTSMTFSLLQAPLIGGISDALTAAQGRLSLQAWRLRQLGRRAPG